MILLSVFGLFSCGSGNTDHDSAALNVGSVIVGATPQSFTCEVKDSQWMQVGQDVWRTAYTGENILPAALLFTDENGNDITDRVELVCFRDFRNNIVSEMTEAGTYTATVRAKWDSNETRTLTFEITEPK